MLMCVDLRLGQEGSFSGSELLKRLKQCDT